ncbi:MAG: signal peptidase I [Kineosporiaceae bacterium]|nr:signal peptidase I [Aeromicrobium sp.]
MKTTIRYTRQGVRVLVNLVIVVVILASLAFILPSLFGYSRYVITGGSMSGTFERGSLAFEKIVPVADLRVGDIITYRPPAKFGIDGLVTHRIVSINAGKGGDLFRTKGDANATQDPWQFQLQQGTQPRVTYTVPYVGYAFLALGDRHIRMLLIGIPAGIIAILSLVELVGALRSPAGKRTTPIAPAGSGADAREPITA